MSRVLLVHARAGAPPEYTIPKVAGVATVNLLCVTPLPPTARAIAETCCETVIDISGEEPRAEELVERITRTALETGAQGVVTFSEFAVIAVAEACQRLGLPGPGPHIRRARDKRAMRRVWEQAGVPVPTWFPVDSPDDLRSAWNRLNPPLLLKSAWSAAAVGQVMVRDEDDLSDAWQSSHSALAGGGSSGFSELRVSVGDPDSAAGFLVDEIIPSSIHSWYDDDRYGDHISVEGVVVEGHYHPVCITSKAPTSPPFTERANFTPCVMPPERQRRIEEVARRAVDALELSTCATHTEMKLLDGERVCMLETAARFGGVLLTREVEHVHGVDMIGAYTRAALGEKPGLPDSMLVEAAARAAGSVALYAADAQGRPWKRLPRFVPDQIDWGALVSPGTKVEVFDGLTQPSGSPMPLYDAAAGYLNSAGLVFLTAPDPATLVADAHAIMNGLEDALLQAAG
ncbi:ATP-grasp domain-containing protein [Streptomyces sp. NPDC048106]|uniref:ATP-grasp domain-containing protein n=1 Tax=Streptomyces sp. NPDC048106 TaxID=3155750 RepID=UPI003453D600